VYKDIYHYGLLATAVSSFFVAFIVYIKAYEDNKKSAFLLINAAIGLWAFCLFIFHTLHQPQISWLIFSQLVAIFIPVTFIHFVFVLLDELPQRKKQLILFYLLALALGLLSFTKLSIVGITYKEVIGYHLVPGPAYRVFSGMFFFLMIYGFILMIKALKKNTGFRKNQIRYFLVGSFLGFGGAIFTFLPLYDVSIPPLGILAVPGYGIILAYAMLKRRLMDIRTVVSKGLIFSATTVSIFILFLFIGLKVATYYHLGIILDLRIFLYILALCFFLVIILTSFRRNLEQLIEKLIFKKTISSSRELIKGSQKLVTILDEKKLSEFFLQTLVRATDVRWGNLWLRKENKVDYSLTAIMGERGRKTQIEKPFLKEDSSFSRIFKKEGRILLREEIFSLLRDIEDGNIIEDELRNVDFSLVIPLFFKNSIKGWVFLGEKKSGDMFSHYELQALSLFTEQAAIAITNAQLFRRINRMKEYNERIVTNVDSGLIVVNEEGKITTFNKKAEEITSVSSYSVLQKDLKVLPSPLNEIIFKSWQSKRPLSIPELALRTGEDNIIVSVKTSLIEEESGQMGVIAILMDLTEVKRMEERMRQTEKLASIGSMVSQLAHEIKNPLSSIRTFTELLPEKFQEEEFRKEFFSLVSGEINRIDALINRMLNLGKVNIAEYKTISIREIIKDTLSSLSIHLREQNIRIKTTYCREPLLIWGDPQGLREVFSNIIINSIQAMPEGGNISISIQRKKRRGTDGNFLEINITDEGGGISEKYLHRIFDPFFTTKPQGSGLGLYICYQIIQGHGGEIRVKNTSSGANFTILLPLSETNIPVEKKRKIYG